MYSLHMQNYSVLLLQCEWTAQRKMASNQTNQNQNAVSLYNKRHIFAVIGFKGVALWMAISYVHSLERKYGFFRRREIFIAVSQ